MDADVAARFEALRARQQRLRAAVREQIAVFGDEGSAPVVATVDDRGLLNGLTIDPSIRHRIGSEVLALAVDRAIRSVQKPAVAVLRAIGLDPSAADDTAIERAAALLSSAMVSLSDEALHPDPHLATDTGVRVTAAYGVVRSVTCDPAWLARSTDVTIADRVVAVCRRAALASDVDLGQGRG
jgi:hypothetical protein